MKLFSTTALGLALALGGGTLLVNPAIAQKKAAPAPKLSKEVREPLSAAQTAIAAGDAATGTTRIAEAKAAAKTPEEVYYVHGVMLELAKIDNKPATQREAIAGILASGKAAPEQVPTLYLVGGQLAYQANDFAAAEKMLDQAVKANTSNTDAQALLVEAQHKQGKTAEALQTLQGAIDQRRTAGTKAPNEWYARGISMAYTAKLAPQTASLSQAWVRDYPNATNWRDALVTYSTLNKLDADTQLDLMRLQRQAGALRGQADYMEYVLATYLRYPGEAKAVLDEGVRAGVLKLDKGGNAAEINSVVAGKVQADKASLGASATKAKGASGTGKSAMSTADAYLGYSDWTNAAEMYRVAIQKGGVDASVANTRLALALGKLGQKDAAKQALAAANSGPRGGLNQYVAIWVDQQA